MIIGVTGTHCAGKDTVAHLLEQKGYTHYSLSDYLRAELQQEGKPTTRQNTIDKGNELREKHGPDILARKAIDTIKPDKRYVITSIRNPAELAALRNVPGFVLLVVDAPTELRYQRMQQRQSASDDTAIQTFDDFKQLEHQEQSQDSTKQQLHLILAQGDHTIINDSTVDELNNKLTQLLPTLVSKSLLNKPAGQTPKGGTMTGICLASQQIRELIDEGRLTGSALADDQIQPASFEPTLGNEVYILDSETPGIFRPQQGEQLLQTLLKIPERQRRKINITNGFEIKKGFTYLFPLNERVILKPGEYIKSSTKSSFGRLFLHTRLLADYNPCFDEVNAMYNTGNELHLWLLVQPLTFNMVVHPGIKLNQLRFFQGHNALLSSSEAIQEFTDQPYLYTQEFNSLKPVNPIVLEGVQIHLDLSGNHTKGIKAFRARHNPDPIDLKNIGGYASEHYFEPIIGDGPTMTLKKGEYYLLVSKEVFKMPAHLNAELKSHSHISLKGPVHFAGFIDNGFEGHLVLELRSDEISNMVLTDGMPIGKFDLYRTPATDKVYGKDIGSNYDGQRGIRLSKYFNSAF